MHDDFSGVEAGFHKIICLLAGINHHGNHRNDKHGKYKSGEEFFNDIPVEYFHQSKTASLKRSKSSIKNRSPSAAIVKAL